MSLSKTSIRERGTKMIYISDIYTTAPTDDRVATEKKVYQILDKLKISYERVDNDVVETMEECEEIDKALVKKIILGVACVLLIAGACVALMYLI